MGVSGFISPAAEPLRKSARIGNLNVENNMLPDTTDKSATLPLPDEMPKSRPVGIDATTNQSNTVPPDATNSKSAPPDETGTKDDNAVIVEPTDEKPSRGVFKTKTITIHRSKDLCTFKCSVCGTRAPTLCELKCSFHKEPPQH